MLNEKYKNFIDKFKNFSSGDKKIKLITIVGLIGITLIFISSFDFGKNSKPKENINNSNVITEEQYVSKLEKKILELVQNIQGVGTTKVMITLENGVENVYVNETKKESDKTQDNTSDQKNKITQSDNLEQKIIIVDTGNGKKEALIKTQLQPKVKGVVIVCQGGSDLNVKQNVTDAVKIALNITSNRVFVTQLTQ